MKTPISYFLLALTALSVATTVTAIRPVLDTDGDVIFTTGSYYVLPFVRGQGGGVALAGKADDIATCPKDVVQVSSEMDDGLPVIFSNWRPRVAFVPQNTNLNIKTELGMNICMRSAYWWVDMFTIEMKHMFLTVGPKPQDYEDSLNSFFQIEEAGHDKYIYKIKFCRGDYAGEPFCGNVGIIVEKNGVRRLAITNGKAFLVQFKKADVIETVLSKKNM